MFKRLRFIVAALVRFRYVSFIKISRLGSFIEIFGLPVPFLFLLLVRAQGVITNGSSLDQIILLCIYLF